MLSVNCSSIFLKKNYKKNKTKQKQFTLEKIIKRKGDKLYVKWKGYDNLFNSWIDKKRHSINKRIFSKTKILRSKS